MVVDICTYIYIVGIVSDWDISTIVYISGHTELTISCQPWTHGLENCR